MSGWIGTALVMTAIFAYVMALDYVSNVGSDRISSSLLLASASSALIGIILIGHAAWTVE